MLKIISLGIVESLGFGIMLGTMLGMGVEPNFSLEFMSRITLTVLSLVVVIFIGYKTKEGWGAAIGILLYVFVLLYINGLLWDLFRYFI
jgi:phosphoglycerol transferase MdoB-like AlkP superfamily enzyme